MARVRLALVALVLAAAAPLGAQEISPAAAAASPTSSSISLIAPAPTRSAPVANVASAAGGPTFDAGRAGFQAPLATEAVAAGATRAGLGQARAMMIVGGAAILAGAIIGNDAGAFIMVGGAVIGLVGLYEYLQ